MRVQEIEKSQPEQKKYYEEKYQVAKNAYDLSYVFFEKATQLLRENGSGAFIFPHKFFNSAATETFRNFLIENTFIDKISHFGANMVFDNADTYTCIAVFSKQKNNGFYFQRFPYQSDFKRLLEDETKYSLLEYSELKDASELYGTNQWIPFDDDTAFSVFKKMYKSKQTFGDVFEDIFQGLATSNDKLYVLDKISGNTYKVPLTDKEYELEQDLFKPFLLGRDVHRYCQLETKRYVFFPYAVKNGKAEIVPLATIKKNYPKTYLYLMENERAFKARESGKAGKMECWYAYIYPKNLSKFEQPKLSSMEICSICPNVTMNSDNFYHATTVYSWVKKDSEKAPYGYFLALANSKLFWWFLQLTGDTLQGDARRLKSAYLNPFPIPTATPDEQEKLSTLADQMLTTHKQLDTALSDADKKMLQQRIDILDNQINTQVYKLYGLTEEEIKTVEGK